MAQNCSDIQHTFRPSFRGFIHVELHAGWEALEQRSECSIEKALSNRACCSFSAVGRQLARSNKVAQIGDRTQPTLLEIAIWNISKNFDLNQKFRKNKKDFHQKKNLNEWILKRWTFLSAQSSWNSTSLAISLIRVARRSIRISHSELRLQKPC